MPAISSYAENEAWSGFKGDCSLVPGAGLEPALRLREKGF